MSAWTELLVQTVASAVGAVIGGGLSIGVAVWLFHRERTARELDRAEQKARRRDDEAQHLRDVRASAAAKLTTAYVRFVNNRIGIRVGNTTWAIEDALMSVLADGTEEAVLVDKWVRLQIHRVRELQSEANLVTGNVEAAAFLSGRLVRSMLIAWFRQEPGTLETFQRHLDVAGDWDEPLQVYLET